MTWDGQNAYELVGDSLKRGRKSRNGKEFMRNRNQLWSQCVTAIIEKIWCRLWQKWRSWHHHDGQTLYIWVAYMYKWNVGLDAYCWEHTQNEKPQALYLYKVLHLTIHHEPSRVIGYTLPLSSTCAIVFMFLGMQRYCSVFEMLDISWGAVVLQLRLPKMSRQSEDARPVVSHFWGSGGVRKYRERERKREKEHKKSKHSQFKRLCFIAIFRFCRLLARNYTRPRDLRI